ncbi:hypothetical protein PMAYCL1PPCAC_23204, partial [Pristionchus mayeri]
LLPTFKSLLGVLRFDDHSCLFLSHLLVVLSAPPVMDLSLEDIIARNKANKRNAGGQRGGRPMRRNGGGGMNGAAFNSSPRGGSYRAAVPSGIAKEINANRRVRINISNLAPSVRTGDLEELFGSYNLESASVNYGEGGEHLGTGDVVLAKRDAHRILNDFHGVTVDGQRLTMILVEDPTLNGGSIFNRVKLAGGGGGVQRRPMTARPVPYPQHPQQQRRGGFGGGVARGGGRGGRGGRVARPTASAADLDAELDAYMKKH